MSRLQVRRRFFSASPSWPHCSDISFCAQYLIIYTVFGIRASHSTAPATLTEYLKNHLLQDEEMERRNQARRRSLGRDDIKQAQVRAWRLPLRPALPSNLGSLKSNLGELISAPL